MEAIPRRLLNTLGCRDRLVCPRPITLGCSLGHLGGLGCMASSPLGVLRRALCAGRGLHGGTSGRFGLRRGVLGGRRGRDGERCDRGGRPGCGGIPLGGPPITE